MVETGLTFPDRGPKPAAVTMIYGGILVLVVGLFFGIRAIGEGLQPGTHITVGHPKSAPGQHGRLPDVLISLVTIMVAARVFGTLFQRFGQPRVIGEVVAGIVIGPSLLGRIAPVVTATLLPTPAIPVLEVLAQLGVILYMFLVGLELNSGLLRSRAHTTIAISHASIVLPFLLGALLALAAYTRYAPQGVDFTSFALFLGVAMAITAFPVLARILTDLKIEQSALGVIALSCAAADDVTAWCLLAFVVGIAKADLSASVMTTMMSLGYIALMFVVVRPLLARVTFMSRSKELTAWLLVGVIASAFATEKIGIHAIFGAFLLGAIIPHDSETARSFRLKLEDVVSILLLPAFFAITGARTQIGLVSQPSDWMFCGLIILVATLGKFGGTVAAARATGLDWRTSSSLGVLMNTRGLMELIVLNIGLDLGVISPTLFAMMVLMALATTIATTPILKWLSPEATTRST